MGKVIYSMMVSLDGFIEGPNQELDWAIIDAELHQFVNDQQSEIDTYLYGRRTYEVMIAYWPTADANPSAPAFEVEYARIWKEMPKVVFSRTLDAVEWNSRLVRDNVTAEVTMLKEQPGKDLAVGGASIAATLMQLGLIDEDRTNLQLVATRTFGTGVVYLRYRGK
jgi:dihydrofolate reductase